MKHKPVEVIASQNFIRDLKRLRKHFRHVSDDIQPVTEQLKNGETLGDRIPGLDEIAYKVRVPNRDAKKVKSGGYRMLYYFRSGRRIYLVAVYSKKMNERIFRLSKSAA